MAAAAAGELGGLVVGGVDLGDLADPALARRAVEAAGFVVALELRESEVTRVADVVFPVAPVTDRSGTFVNWEGRVRPFGQVLHNPSSLPDLRVLAGIAEEMGTPLGFRTSEQVWDEMVQVGPWDGERPRSMRHEASTRYPARAGSVEAPARPTGRWSWRPGSSRSTTAGCRTGTTPCVSPPASRSCWSTRPRCPRSARASVSWSR